MKYIFTESQIKKIINEEIDTDMNEIKISGIVTDFIDDIKNFEDSYKLVKSLNFRNFKDMVSYILDNDYEVFNEIRKEAYDYIEKYKNN
jgi:hypothetical protein